MLRYQATSKHLTARRCGFPCRQSQLTPAHHAIQAVDKMVVNNQWQRTFYHVVMRFTRGRLDVWCKPRSHLERPLPGTSNRAVVENKMCSCVTEVESILLRPLPKIIIFQMKMCRKQESRSQKKIRCLYKQCDAQTKTGITKERLLRSHHLGFPANTPVLVINPSFHNGPLLVSLGRDLGTSTVEIEEGWVHLQSALSLCILITACYVVSSFLG